MSENLNSEITQRFIDELERKKLKAKTLSRNIGAHENSLGIYVRIFVYFVCVYFIDFVLIGVDIRFVLV